ncbi:MAG: hypothetical protein CL927_20730 [Deltaproteobacteria bacterium]|mgnify:CR=1 FL=1|nr:hypothetical protein [Deltaproteobacteria bacterium]HCH62974.1 hypothetical protein [Deltaproteobacteria bacterium]
MKLLASVLLFAWVGAGEALAQDSSNTEPDLQSAQAEAPQEANRADAADNEQTGSSAPTDPPFTGPSASEEMPEAASGPSPVGEEAAEPENATLDALNRKLLGDKPDILDAPSARRMEEMDLPETPGWIWPIGLTLLALLIGLRWQLNRGGEAPSRLRVVQRVMLGRDGNLAVVEVGDEGDRRRLLVGYGGGAPRLVAELDVPDAAADTPPSGTDSAARGWQRALRRALPASGGQAPEGLQGASEARLRPRTSLIAEVLAERDAPEVAQGGPSGRTGRSVTVAGQQESVASPVVEPPEKGEDGDPTDTYTFRGLIG